MKAVYVLSTPDRLPNKIFKIGRTTQTQEELRKRYKTSLIEPLILSYIPVVDDIKSEQILHNTLKPYRLSNSEWFQCELGFIMTELCKLQLSQEQTCEITIHNNPVSIDYEQKELYRKLYYWIVTETLFSDFLITQVKPYVKGFYKLRSRNYWTPLNWKPTYKNNLYKLFKRNVFSYPSFFSNDMLYKTEDPLVLVSNSFGSVKRKNIQFSLDKTFLDLCVAAVSSISMDKTISKNVNSFLKTPQQMSGSEVYFISNANDQLSVVDLNHISPLVIKTVEHPNLLIDRTDNNDLRNNGESNKEGYRELITFENKDDKVFDVMTTLFVNWIPDTQKLLAFKRFVRDCLIDQTTNQLFVQKTKLPVNSFIFSSDDAKINKVDENMDSYADNTLIGEFVYTLLNLFFSGSALRVIGKDAISWASVKNYVQNYSAVNSVYNNNNNNSIGNTSAYVPRLLLIYSSTLVEPTKAELFNNVMCNVTYQYDHETFSVEKQRCKPNFIIIRPEKRFESFILKEEPNLLPHPNMLNIEYLVQQHPTLLDNITYHTMWQAIYYFLDA